MLVAQREACAACIAGQRHQGWVEAGEIYDDGGFSGGNMERPAMQRLPDLDAAVVDCVQGQLRRTGSPTVGLTINKRRCVRWSSGSMSMTIAPTLSLTRDPYVLANLWAISASNNSATSTLSAEAIRSRTRTVGLP